MAVKGQRTSEETRRKLSAARHRADVRRGSGYCCPTGCQCRKHSPTMEHRQKIVDGLRASKRVRENIARLAKRQRTEAQLAWARQAGRRRRGSTFKLSDDAKHNIRAAAKRAYATGRHVVSTGAAVAAAANLKRGRPLAPDHLTRLRISGFGVSGWRHTAENRRKMSEAARRSWASRSRKRAEITDRRRAAQRMVWRDMDDAMKSSRVAPMLEAKRLKALKKPTGLERTAMAMLDALGVIYIRQHPIGRYAVDFFIPDRHLVIECDGEYWHSRPLVLERDRVRDAALTRHGYRVLRLSEAEIDARETSRIREALSC